MRLWIGVITFLAGATLWRVSRREPPAVPTWLSRLALGMVALGLGTLAMTQPGLGWYLASIASSLVAIALILSVLREIIKR